MADYAFFLMGVFALVVAVIVGTVCILLTIACIVAARKSRKPSSGLVGFILALGSVLTCGITALPGLVFALVGIRQKAYPRLSWTAAVLSASVIVLCTVETIRFFSFSGPPGITQQVVAVSDTVLARYQAIFEVDRRAMGFPPLPTKGMVKIETVDRANWGYEYPPPTYDVMLHFYDIVDGESYPYVARTVALKRTTEGLKWVHEQIVYHGPRRYTTVDGTFNEQITLTCEKEQVAVIGTALTGTAVSYSGNDTRLAGLTIAQVGPILREWGYDYDIENAQQPPGSDPSKTANDPAGTLQE